MGMQCFLKLTDIEEAGFTVKRDGYAAIVEINGEPHWYFNCSDNLVNQDAWFDIGKLQPAAIDKLHWLIRNRICFQCS